jgi:hypothetical protein
MRMGLVKKLKKDLAISPEGDAHYRDQAPTDDGQQDRKQTDVKAVLAYMPLLWVGVVHPYQEDDNPNQKREEREYVKNILQRSQWLVLLRLPIWLGTWLRSILRGLRPAAMGANVVLSGDLPSTSRAHAGIICQCFFLLGLWSDLPSRD